MPLVPTHIIIHESASRYGSPELINEWHLDRGYRMIGYHYVITNGHKITSRTGRINSYDGLVHKGREETQIGAHARGSNSTSLGIVLVGRGGRYTMSQLATVYCLVASLMIRYDIPIKNIIGHYETKNQQAKGLSRKKCPSLDMPMFRLGLVTIHKSFQDGLACLPPEAFQP